MKAKNLEKHINVCITGEYMTLQIRPLLLFQSLTNLYKEEMVKRNKSVSRVKNSCYANKAYKFRYFLSLCALVIGISGL